MTDKVQKIREEVERLRKSYQIMYQELDYESPELISVCAKRNLCQDILIFIDSMEKESAPLTKENSTPLSGGERADSSKQGNSVKKNFRERYKRIAESTEFMSSHDGMSIGEVIPVESEEPISIWHNASEKPERENLLIETNDGRIIHRQSINNYGMVKRWAYTSDLLNLDNSCNFGKNWKEPVSNPIDFEQELYKAFGQVKDFTLGMRIAKRFYDMGKNSQAPVSDLEEAAFDYTEACKYNGGKKLLCVEHFKAGAKWQKEHGESAR